MSIERKKNRPGQERKTPPPLTRPYETIFSKNEMNGIQKTDTLTPTDKFYDRRKQGLLLTAKGCSRSDLSEQLRVSEDTIDSDRTAIFGKLGVQSIDQAMIRSLQAGIISPEEVLADFNQTQLDKLRTSEKRVLELLTQPDREETSNKTLAKDLSVEPETVTKYFTRIFRKTGIESKAQAAAIYYSIRMQTDNWQPFTPIEETYLPPIESALLRQLTQITTQESLEQILLSDGNRELYHRLRHRFETNNPFETIFAGIRKQFVTGSLLESKPEEASFEQLPPEDIALLDRFIANEGRDTTTRQVADDLGIVPEALTDRVEDIRQNLRLGGRRIHPAVLYYARHIKQQRENE
jgi:DNA-binding NarL/FixJ family response regulator